MEIVPFTKEDQEATATFLKVIYHEMGWDQYGDPDGITDLASFFHMPHDGQLLLVKKNGNVLGTGGYTKLTEKDILLKRFFIAKEIRGSGIALQLLEKLMTDIKKLAVSRVVLDVTKINKRAIRFYEKNGFTQYDQAPITGWPESERPDIFNYYFLKI